MADGALILVAGLLLAGALLGSLIAERLRLPGLLLFLLVGMVIGWDGTGWVGSTTSRSPGGSACSPWR